MRSKRRGTKQRSKNRRVDIATEPIANADYFGVLLIPGGWGARALVADDELIQKLTEIASLSEYCLTVCTASGVSAGMDMALGFVADRFGAQKAKEIADYIEYLWNSDPDHDLFAV